MAERRRKTLLGGGWALVCMTIYTNDIGDVALVNMLKLVSAELLNRREVGAVAWCYMLKRQNRGAEPQAMRRRLQ